MVRYNDKKERRMRMWRLQGWEGWGGFGEEVRMTAPPKNPNIKLKKNKQRNELTKQYLDHLFNCTS